MTPTARQFGARPEGRGAWVKAMVSAVPPVTTNS